MAFGDEMSYVSSQSGVAQDLFASVPTARPAIPGTFSIGQSPANSELPAAAANAELASVPEPAAIVLLGSVLALVARGLRRRLAPPAEN